MDLAAESALRVAIMDWVRERAEVNGGFLRRHELLSFNLGGRDLPLIDFSRGIRNPAGLSSTLSIVESMWPRVPMRPTVGGRGSSTALHAAEGPQGQIRSTTETRGPSHAVNCRRALADVWVCPVREPSAHRGQASPR